jgi:hypothetical protein
LIDHENLARAKVHPDGDLLIGSQRYGSLILPAGVDLPNPAAAIVAAFSEAGGRVLRDGAGNDIVSSTALLDALGTTARIRPGSERIVLGRFTRDGRDVLVIVNVGDEVYKGALSPTTRGDWLTLNPATGAVEQTKSNENGRISLVLESHQTRVFVQNTSAE